MIPTSIDRNRTKVNSILTSCHWITATPFLNIAIGQSIDAM